MKKIANILIFWNRVFTDSVYSFKKSYIFHNDLNDGYTKKTSMLMFACVV